MPGLPISAMVAATQFANADVFPIVHAGANLKCTRSVFLTAIPGEGITISAGTSDFTVHSTGQVEALLATSAAIKVWFGNATEHLILGPGCDFDLLVKAGFNFNVTTGLGNQFLIDNLGNVQVIGAPGAAMFWGVGANGMTMIDGGGVQFTCDPGVLFFVPYLDGSGGAWKVAPPADLNTAIDRIASWIHTQFAVLIP